MHFLKRKQNIIFSSIIALLLIALIVTGSLLIIKSDEGKSVSPTAASYSEEVAKHKKNESELKSQLNEANKKNNRLESEKKALEDENSSLISEMVELAAKEQAAADALASEQAKQRTEEIIRRLSLPMAEQKEMMPGVCYLTFDDGPSHNTLLILNTLKKYNIKATFFVTGTGTNSYIRTIHEQGHAIGLHTNSHRYDLIYTSVEAYLTDLEAVSNLVCNLTGVKSQIMRFPGGSSNTISSNYNKGIMTELTKRLPEMGYSYYDWNVSSGDANGNNIPKEVLANNVLTQAKGKSSICVLMHDNSAKKTTADALPLMIEGLVEMGFRFEAITPGTYGYHHNVYN